MTLSVFGADPSLTSYTFEECKGSAMPYPVPDGEAVVPDTLRAVFINHVGRHGARYPSSAANTAMLRDALAKADSLGTITPLGRRLRGLTDRVMKESDGYWGALDSLGRAEQRGIASRMFMNYPELFMDGKVNAISSYAPRCVMSMYEFTHQLDRLNNKVEIRTSAGRQNSPLMRPFDLSRDYTDYIRGKVWETPYEDYLKAQVTDAPLRRVLGEGYPLTADGVRRLAMAEYQFLAGLSAMGIDTDLSEFLTRDEMNALWGCFNLRQYLQRTATTLSAVPAEIASELVLDLIRTTDEAVAGNADARVMLRFGHAETLLPLYSLLRIKGGYYLTNYFDTVATHFRDFEMVPMAGNMQMIVLEDAAGRHYVRFEINERPIVLMPNDDRTIVPWAEARAYMIRCLPLIYQP